MKLAIYGNDTLLVDTFRARGAQVSLFGSDFFSSDDFPSDADALLCLGGDGTFLRALPLLGGRDIPVAGINFGRLGFLTTARFDSVRDAWIDDLLEGRFTVEDRSLIKASSGFFPGSLYPYAANEFSVQKKGMGVLEIDVRLDGLEMPSYWADGIVVCAPTGSTAYNLSIGGPVVFPGANVFVMAPIAPHNLNMRPIVLPDSSVLDITFSTRDGSALVTLDNRSVEVPSGTAIRVSKGEYGFRYMNLGGHNFIAALRSKLLWGEDCRNRKN